LGGRVGSAEALVEVFFDALPICVAEVSEATKNDAVVESEELEANDAWQRETCVTEVFEVTVARPRVVASCCDHCQDGVAGGVKGGTAEH
jgi:hypothetical protein